MESLPPRPAATLIIIRDPASSPRVLVGRRSPDATFMPGSYVFPGGAVDEIDFQTRPAVPMNDVCARTLGQAGFAIAALRELREETGLSMRGGLDLSGLHYVFRAVTPANYPKRFDARFFVCDAAGLDGNIDRFQPEHPELNDLRWVSLGELGRFALPSITRFVLSGVIKRLPSLDPPGLVPEIGL